MLVRSMSPDDIGRLIRDRVDADLPRPVGERVHDAANGNPFFALEMARELARSGPPDVGETLPLPDDLRALLVDRISALPEPTRQILLTTAAAARPTLALLAAASGEGPGTEGTLKPADRLRARFARRGRIGSRTRCWRRPCIRQLPQAGAERPTTDSRRPWRIERKARGT